ncbi:hypothetical protein C8Q76DRAFT_800829 [Earliella scabrosa]|nr:hypothetical protein C8Q76DRAFT_800829 [Earliella scabrosa]
MTTIPESYTQPSLSDTLGAFLIGTCCALVLYGVVLHQAYGYFRVYSEDALWLKALVIAALVLETIVTGFNVDACYNLLVTNYSNPDLDRAVYWSFALLAVFPASVAVTCQTFFARRVWLIGRRYRIIVYTAVILMLAELGFPIACTVEIFRAPHLDDALKWAWLVSARNAAATATDFLLTAVLIYSLRKSRTGIKRTDSMINILIMYAINTGKYDLNRTALDVELTRPLSAFNVLCLICGAVLPQSFTYVAVDLVASRLYANSLLAALNSRKLVSQRGKLDNTADAVFGTVVMSPRSIQLSSFAPAREEHSMQPIRATLNITREESTLEDDNIYTSKVPKNLEPEDCGRV